MRQTELVKDPFGDVKDGHILTRAIIDTIHEPLVVLDEDLRIIVASFSFYKKFDLTPEKTQGKFFYDVGKGEWDIPALRTVLSDVVSNNSMVKGFEVERDLPFFGLRILHINAREFPPSNEGAKRKMLVSIFDVTDQRNLEHEKEKLIIQKDLLLKEMRHRIANSLQLIASILLLKAETVSSKETKAHLEDAHERILSIATVQQQLDPVEVGQEIEVAHYLKNLCKSLARSMIAGRKPITVTVDAGPGTASSDTVISFGLIITELVINAIKHAFAPGQEGEIIVSYKCSENGGWTLSVRDNGKGLPEGGLMELRVGLGTSIIGALSNQLQATIRTETSPTGTTVSLIHAGL